MNERLKKYFDSLFEGAPDTKESRELKEEIFRNTLDRYNDLIAQGKSEDASFTQAVARIGDIDELIALCNIDRTGSGENYYSEEDVEKNRKLRNRLLYITIALYFVSFLPPVVLTGFRSAAGIVIMLVFIGIATGMAFYSINMKIDAEKNSGLIDLMKKKKGGEFGKAEFEKKRHFDNVLISSAAAFVIFSLIPVVIYAFEKRHGNIAAAVTMLFLMAGFGAAVFYRFNKQDTDFTYPGTMVEKFKEWNRGKEKNLSVVKMIDRFILITSVFLYVVFSLKTRAWLILLLIFVMAFILMKIVKNFVEYRELIKK